jgi:hypothetical protein
MKAAFGQKHGRGEITETERNAVLASFENDLAAGIFAGWCVSKKTAVILSGAFGGFATKAERRIADSKRAETARDVRTFLHRLRPFQSAILRCVPVAKPPGIPLRMTAGLSLSRWNSERRSFARLTGGRP